MKHSNISIFVPHIGCPNKCSFCDQHTISGSRHAPTADEVREVCGRAICEVRSPENAEIAFFGGSFTAIPRSYMTELLSAASDFVGEGKFRGIRISTRPDCISEGILRILEAYGVTAVELGAQSMCDHVLDANERGHSAEDVVNACRLIRSFGDTFELGLQMMIGLYKSSPEDEAETLRRITELAPDTLRIYPTVILKGTRLAELLEAGEYVPFSFDTAVEIAAKAMITAEKNGIRVIKCGLHASEFVERDMVGGFYHPAFRELCEGLIYRYGMGSAFDGSRPERAVFAVAPDCISKAVGHKRCNISYFKKIGTDIVIVGEKGVPKYKCVLRSE